jgi:hypothetical protein
MVRKLVLVVLLATLAACTGSITAPEETPTRGGGIHTSGG